MNVLSFDHVTFGYAEAELLLRDVCLDVLPGERIAILGGNGSGKSTLLRLAAGLAKPRSGHVRLLSNCAPAFLFQNPRQQLICSSVREELEYTLRIQGMDRAEAVTTAERFLSTFGLARQAEQHPKSLSGGQQQKLALAALLTRQPELLLLDEPDAFMDGAARQSFREFLAEHGRGAVLWTCCRRSEVPDGFRELRLQNGRLHA